MAENDTNNVTKKYVGESALSVIVDKIKSNEASLDGMDAELRNMDTLLKEMEAEIKMKSDDNHTHSTDDITNFKTKLAAAVLGHDVSTTAHNDIRALIEGITTSKVNVADITDNLTTNVTNKPLSAAQGVAIKGLIEDLQLALDTHNSTHAPSNAQPNQNAFSNIKVGTTTIAADTATDTLELVGDNVTITPDATNDKVTIAVADASTTTKGIVQLTDSISSDSTTTAATPKSVMRVYNMVDTRCTEMEAFMADKADSVHKHSTSDITGLSANLALRVPITRTINGKALSSDITLTAEDIGISGGSSDPNAMSATNPTGTGSLSINRLSGSTVGTNSVAVGTSTEASGINSNAEGHLSKASGEASHAEGHKTTASGNTSHAEGYNTTASDYASHAEGCNTTANGYASHAEGYNNFIYINSTASHAEGQANNVLGENSHVEGYGNIVQYNQHVQGHFNNESVMSRAYYSGISGTAFVIGNGSMSNDGNKIASNAFRVDYDGKVYTYQNGAYNTSGADYAEFFEWQDLNIGKEDRRGYFVTLDGEKIKIAEPSDYILGIVSSSPGVIGNSDEDWRGRYILDEFGSAISEEFEYEEEVHEEIVNEETGETTIETKTVTKTGTRYKQNPDYDPTLAYIQRADRPEWATVGMMGVLHVRDDGTCQVNGCCKVAEGGIATASENGYRVIKRVNDNIVKVVFK